MIVVEHRPPLKRIEIGPKPAPTRPPVDMSLAYQAIAGAHQDLEKERAERIWRTVVQASQGQGSVEE